MEQQGEKRRLAAILAANVVGYSRLMGDSMLVEFASAVAAAQCAVEVQRAMAQRNAEVSSTTSS